MPKTHIVLVHGAYHQAWHWHLLRQQLESAGYAVTTPQNPSAGLNIANGTLAEDTANVKAAIEAAAETADRIIVVCHSYGGIPGSDAVAEVSDATKAKIVRLVYLAALVIEQGTSLAAPGRVAKWAQRDGPTLSVPDPMPTFYHDVKSAALAQEACEKLVKQAHQPFDDETKHRGWKEYPVTYVSCAQDFALPGDRYILRVKGLIAEHGMQDRWELLTLESGHSPFLSMPGVTARIIRRACGEELTLENVTVDPL